LPVIFTAYAAWVQRDCGKYFYLVADYIIAQRLLRAGFDLVEVFTIEI